MTERIEKETICTPSGEKQYEELSITDNFLLCKIMEKNPSLCRELLEVILGIEIRDIIFAGKEQTVGITPKGKSVRLDVYVADDAGTVYDLEMQVASNKNLPKRTRYYQGIMDLNLLEKGADYSELGRSYVIFICTFDYFKSGLPVYTFTNRCSELRELELGDDTVKIFINPDGDTTGLSEDMTAFLRYLKGEQTQNNALVGRMAHEVLAARSCEEWRVEYMTLMMELRERYNEGREEGRQLGMKQGREQGIRVFVLDKMEENVPEEKIIEKLQKGFHLSEEKARYYYERVVSER